VNKKAVNLYNKALELIKADKPSQAKRDLEKAIKFDPNFFQAHTSLGTIYEREGLYKRALNFYQKANTLYPNNPIILTNIGNAYRMLGDTKNSLKSYRYALSIDPKYPNPSIYMCSLLVTIGENSSAKDLISLHENDTAYYLFLNSLLFSFIFKKDKKKDAQLFENALNAINRLSLDNTTKSFLRGLYKISSQIDCAFSPFLSELTNQLEDKYLLFADFLLELATDIKSCKSLSHYFSSIQLMRSGNAEGALKEIELGIKSGLPTSLHAPLIDALYFTNQEEAASNALIKIKHEIAASPVTAGLLFRLHDFKSGWAHYRRSEISLNHLEDVLDNVDFGNKSLLLLSKQGLGDVVLFLSCLNDFIEKYNLKTCTINCDPRLHTIIKESFPSVNCIWESRLFDGRRTSKNDPLLISYDYILKLSSICSLTRQSLSSFYPPQKYLLVNANKKNKFRERIKGLPGKLNVGFAWKGGNIKNSVIKKSSSLENFLPLFSLQDVNWINLQYGNDIKSEITSFNKNYATNLIHFDDIDPLESLESQIALISNLDLVIQTSNTSAHLAAAQGIETWVLVNEPSDFRWFKGKHDNESPWYLKMIIFRKDYDQTWEELISQVTKQLKEALAKK